MTERLSLSAQAAVFLLNFGEGSWTCQPLFFLRVTTITGNFAINWCTGLGLSIKAVSANPPLPPQRQGRGKGG